jgi:hypothetical protein
LRGIGLNNEIKIGGLYQHYKGKNYLVINIAKHSESMEWMVYYQCLYENSESSFWVRPLKMFLENVDIEGVSVPRFKYIGDQKGSQRL